MSNLFEDTPQKDLSWLLTQINQREIALPDFQRDFVWDPSATQELIVSIANNYPAGSLLAIRNTNNYFAAREVEGAPFFKRSKANLFDSGWTTEINVSLSSILWCGRVFIFFRFECS
ncbi:hypothetical protein NITGR_570005 [Nitrospina gracilis 3/211]|uniref:GmrSD restriction endonucleases N-terminal domain-containing protein n=1 Tax=Nitrospina gracilis (strain 3/211) TaxID=1266370 RepID=M1ZCH9_NITG3|nr:DUF262 domain-containing protein [Nitrospina gracilis]CCQ91056.1 hypothetical protein NITGR_570005 [Nitrospina gracilis 3/211]